MNDNTSGSNSGSDSEPKDGFDLLEYPCDYPFKVMCRADPDVAAQDYIRGLIVPLLDDDVLLSMKTNASRTGKFESVTAVIKLSSREELEAIYKLVAQSPRVVMTL